MAQFDVRSQEPEEITSVRFANDRTLLSSYNGISIDIEKGNGTICIMDSDDDTTPRVYKDDIDNFILALKKAKELLD